MSLNFPCSWVDTCCTAAAVCEAASASTTWGSEQDLWIVPSTLQLANLKTKRVMVLPCRSAQDFVVALNSHDKEGARRTETDLTGTEMYIALLRDWQVLLP